MVSDYFTDVDALKSKDTSNQECLDRPLPLGSLFLTKQVFVLLKKLKQIYI